jgi:Ner family transcriptional regulator
MTRAAQPQLNWSRARILYELKEKGLTAAAVARQEGVTRFALYSALERPYPRLHQMIAEALGTSRHDIWPEYYGENGERLSRAEQQRRRAAFFVRAA